MTSTTSARTTRDTLVTLVIVALLALVFVAAHHAGIGVDIPTAAPPVDADVHTSFAVWRAS